MCKIIVAIYAGKIYNINYFSENLENHINEVFI